jgi:hypothetical protein
MDNSQAMNFTISVPNSNKSSCINTVNAVMLNATIAIMTDWGSLNISNLPLFDRVSGLAGWLAIQRELSAPVWIYLDPDGMDCRKHWSWPSSHFANSKMQCIRTSFDHLINL